MTTTRTGPTLCAAATPVTVLRLERPGSFTVRAMARNTSEERSDLVSPLTVVIVSRSPSVDGTPFGLDSVRRESLGTVSGIAVDLDGDSVSLKFDWGDGVISTGPNSSPAAPPSAPARVVERWHLPCPCPCARDTKGAQSLWSAHDSVLVVPPVCKPRWSYDECRMRGLRDRRSGQTERSTPLAVQDLLR